MRRLVGRLPGSVLINALVVVYRPIPLSAIRKQSWLQNRDEVASDMGAIRVQQDFPGVNVGAKQWRSTP
jgi:hypothetical protein